MFKSTAKLSVFALSLSMMTSGCALADFVKNGQAKVAVKRESFEDLIRNDEEFEL